MEIKETKLLEWWQKHADAYEKFEKISKLLNFIGNPIFEGIDAEGNKIFTVPNLLMQKIKTSLNVIKTDSKAEIDKIGFEESE